MTSPAVGRCPVSDEKSACQIPIRHNTLSDGDVKVCLSYDSVYLCRLYRLFFVAFNFFATLASILAAANVAAGDVLGT